MNPTEYATLGIDPNQNRSAGTALVNWYSGQHIIDGDQFLVSVGS